MRHCPKVQSDGSHMLRSRTVNLGEIHPLPPPDQEEAAMPCSHPRLLSSRTSVNLWKGGNSARCRYESCGAAGDVFALVISYYRSGSSGVTHEVRGGILGLEHVFKLSHVRDSKR